MKGVTKRQREILDFINRFIEHQRYSPSYEEIRRHFQFSSLGSVHKHLQALRRKGLIDGEPHCSRSLLPSPEASAKANTPQTIPLTFIGHLTGGSIETFPQTKNISVPLLMVSDHARSYVLQVKGHLWKEEGIDEGDLIVIEARGFAEPGETILFIQDGVTFLKRFYQEEEFARLEALSKQETPSYLPLENLSIQGIVKGLLRAY